MKKAVLEIMDYAAAYRGNFLTSVLSLADELKKHNVETVFVFPERAMQREWSHELSEEGSTVFFMPDDFFGAVKLLKSLFGQYDFLAVHSHFLRSNMYLPLRAVNFFAGVPHYFHAHSTAKQNKKDYKTLIRRFLLSADKMICVGEGVADSYKKLGCKNCITVKNGIGFDRLDSHDKDFSDRFRDGRKYSVLMFGYDFYIKGIDTAIDALDRYDRNHDITLNICVASHMEKAEEFLQKRFKELPSWIRLLPPTSDVASYMRSADVFLSASRTEGMAYAVLEAAYCGSVMALSDITPHTELKLPEAEIFSVENEKELYDAVIRCTQAEKSCKNSQYVRENFSVDKWVTQMCSLLLNGN